MPKCSIIQSGNDYAVKTPYSQAFVSELKRLIPPPHRSFDGNSKAWIVERSYAENCLAQIILDCFGETVTFPEFKRTETETKYSFQLDYVGIPKERDGQDGKTALGFSKGQWRIVFDEDTLKGWFEQCQTERDLPQTLFSLLLVSEKANDQEIKSGYRRLARQWHPDVNREPEAPEMFKKISNAYQVLSDPQKRARYQAGLAFERESDKPSRYNPPRYDVFIPPLRCGNLTVTGTVQVGRLRVSQILKWEDCVNEQGQTMVTSWNREANAIDYQWV